MITESFSIGFLLACVFVGFMVLVGIFTLFVRAENIERNVLVGMLTLATSLIAVCLLVHDSHHGFPYGAPSVVAICLLALFGFFLGRILDLILGPQLHSSETREATLGVDLAD